MPEISIILADAQYLIRIGLRSLLSQNKSFHILDEVNHEAALLESLARHSVKVVILDYNQPSSFNQKTVQRIKEISPRTNVLIISADNNKENIYEVIENGVNSFLTKSCDEEEIIDAVKATAKGEKFFCTKVLDYILERSFGKTEDCSPTPLSPRELEIVRMVASGMAAQEIANSLHLSRHTVYTHRKNIMKKLNLSSTSELIFYAIEHKLVESK